MFYTFVYDGSPKKSVDNIEVADSVARQIRLLVAEYDE